MPRPHNCMAFAEKREGNFEQASRHVLEQLDDPSSTVGALYQAFEIGLSLIPHLVDGSFACRLFDALKASKVVENYPHVFGRNVAAVELIRHGHLDLALDLLDFARTCSGGFEDDFSAINRSQILIRRKEAVPRELRHRLLQIADKGTCLSRFGASIVLKKGRQAIDEIAKEVDTEYRVDGISLKTVAGWPICELLSNAQRRRLAALHDGDASS